MKKLFTYIMFFVVSCAYNIETVKFILKAIGTSPIECVDDFESEEKDSEEKESEKCKEEKKDISVHSFFINNHFPSEVSNSKSLSYNHYYSISSSDFQKEVYSPPEL